MSLKSIGRRTCVLNIKIRYKIRDLELNIGVYNIVIYQTLGA